MPKWVAYTLLFMFMFVSVYGLREKSRLRAELDYSNASLIVCNDTLNAAKSENLVFGAGDERAVLVGCVNYCGGLDNVSEWRFDKPCECQKKLNNSATSERKTQ